MWHLDNELSLNQKHPVLSCILNNFYIANTLVVYEQIKNNSVSKFGKNLEHRAWTAILLPLIKMELILLESMFKSNAGFSFDLLRLL